MNKYITYGFKKFDKEKLNSGIDLKCVIGKPNHTWWGSPINAEYGWKEWCENEEFYLKHNEYKTIEDYFSDKIIWTLEEGSKVLYINGINDLKDFINKGYIIQDEDDLKHGIDQFKFDFFKIKEDYDAIQLNDPVLGHYFLPDYYKLESLCYSWDCESIAVLNPDKIVILEESGN